MTSMKRPSKLDRMKVPGGAGEPDMQKAYRPAASTKPAVPMEKVTIEIPAEQHDRLWAIKRRMKREEGAKVTLSTLISAAIDNTYPVDQ